MKNMVVNESHRPGVRKRSRPHRDNGKLRWHRVCQAREKGRHTEVEFDALCEKYGRRCLACGEVTRLTPDHIVPISQGGSDTIDNIQPLCESCNKSKGAHTMDYRPGGESYSAFEKVEYDVS